MFTGLIEALGIVDSITHSHRGAELGIKVDSFLAEIEVGDSISTNGVCLTVKSKTSTSFLTDVMPYTLKSTNLGNLKVGSHVNLERAMKMNGRLDGHIVTGHVDAIGRIGSIHSNGNSVLYGIDLPDEILSKVILKGSIAIDGISLTIQELLLGGVIVSIIPHTLKATTLSDARVGGSVNVETDIIGKYVERLLNVNQNKSDVSMEFLAKTGFL